VCLLFRGSTVIGPKHEALPAEWVGVVGMAHLTRGEGHLGLYGGGDHLCDDDDHGLEEVLSAFEAVTPLQWTEVLPLPQYLNV
jgi:hypothetical protein